MLGLKKIFERKREVCNAYIFTRAYNRFWDCNATSSSTFSVEIDAFLLNTFGEQYIVFEVINKAQYDKGHTGKIFDRDTK